MTIVAYRDGVMPADSASSWDNTIIPWSRKVARGADGTLYGVCGEGAASDSFLDWVEAGEKGEMPLPSEKEGGGSTFHVLVAHPDGRLYVIEHGGKSIYPGAPYLAIGSGCDFAFGAMAVGADAVAAARAAILHCKSCAGEVRVIRHEGATP